MKDQAIEMSTPLMGKRLILGVTGGIAAYKSVELARQLTKQGADVWVILTENGERFVTPLTLRTITGNPVRRLFDPAAVGEKVEHIALAEGADLMIVAPASANFLAKAAWGLADDLLTTVLLAFKGPKLVAPSMNEAMVDNPIVQANIHRLKEFGFNIIEPEEGWLACGSSGKGRLPAVDTMVEEIISALITQDMAGLKVLITAGGTREFIDPVRFIGNRSSGKMGAALARQCLRRGAEVTLIAAGTVVDMPGEVRLVRVDTASQLYQAVLQEYDRADVIIMAAAVADFRPVAQADRKIKKGQGPPSLTLESTPDILEHLGRLKTKQVLVGFAAETEDLLAQARRKLEQKNLDLVVANDVSVPGLGFESDSNAALILGQDGWSREFPPMDKHQLAAKIIDCIVQFRQNTGS
jgi:phosphopantothenoylcysteine decarboxylase/phosphopantothenate--cysteine ligase